MYVIPLYRANKTIEIVEPIIIVQRIEIVIEWQLIILDHGYLTYTEAKTWRTNITGSRSTGFVLDLGKPCCFFLLALFPKTRSRYAGVHTWKKTPCLDRHRSSIRLYPYPHSLRVCKMILMKIITRGVKTKFVK